MESPGRGNVSRPTHTVLCRSQNCPALTRSLLIRERQVKRGSWCISPTNPKPNSPAEGNFLDRQVLTIVHVAGCCHSSVRHKQNAWRVGGLSKASLSVWRVKGGALHRRSELATPRWHSVVEPALRSASRCDVVLSTS